MSVMSTKTIKTIIQLLAVPVLISFVLKLAFSPQYPVLPKGIILISGASTGIGRHAAEFLADKGYFVLAGVRKEKDMSSISDMKIPNLQGIMLDVTSKESCLDSVATVKQLMQDKQLPFVALLNNAGVARLSAIEYHSVEDAKSIYETNFFGVLQLTQGFLPILRESQGRILMISSCAGKVSTPRGGIYASSKFALEGLSDSLRREVAGLGISVSIIEPAYVKSAIFDKMTGKDVAEPELFTMSAIRRDDTGSSRVAEMLSTYPNLFTESAKAKVLKEMEEASEPTVTTEVIYHAIADPKPQARYVVANVGGMPASAAVFLFWLLPDRVVDVLLTLFI